MAAPAVESTLVRRFQLARAPTLEARVSGTSPIVFSRMRSERARPGRSISPREEGAFAFQVPLIPAAFTSLRYGSKAIALPEVQEPGRAFLFDLSARPTVGLDTQFDNVRCFISQRTIDDLAYERGLRPIGGLVQRSTAVFDHFETRNDVKHLAFGAIGFCIGGHLALRAALDPRCRAAVCAYPTGLHNGNLGAEPDAGTLGRLSEIKAELLLVFGDVDPHVPVAARSIVRSALQASGVRHTYLELSGEHAFMRDEGARYDPEMADRVFVDAIALYRRVLG